MKSTNNSLEKERKDWGSDKTEGDLRYRWMYQMDVMDVVNRFVH
jgi:hypothetical protein